MQNKEFIFAFMEYDSSPNPPYTQCYFAVRENGTLYKDMSWESFKEHTGIVGKHCLDREEIALVEYLMGNKQEDVRVFKGTDIHFIFVWNDKMNDVKGRDIPNWFNSLDSIRFLNNNEYKAYEEEEDSEERYFREMNEYLERDRY